MRATRNMKTSKVETENPRPVIPESDKLKSFNSDIYTYKCTSVVTFFWGFMLLEKRMTC